jgi:hypothetical protein
LFHYGIMAPAKRRRGSQTSNARCFGELAEWLNAPVLKTGER